MEVDGEEQKEKELIYGKFLTFHTMKIAEYMHTFGMQLMVKLWYLL
jgi:hypothetical protein